MKSDNKGTYMFAYFRSGPCRTNRSEKLHYAYSWDGLHWTPLNQNESVWSTKICESEFSFPYERRHGTFFPVNGDELEKLLNYWG